ncbi:low temperature requirement protein A [Xylanimonas protaetiae]|uniref:Low temperature requirement protein A n=1 Tax=Xylanimonas protaetiae TaxID=2509457 RepID=A0A4P6F1N6_9MICO|nr:low temperature requirement protein A [Xylanimonas protaetiae]QAY69384.1 low temperature requirement protein A [Xylanimonas protaetiae]
MTPTQGRAGRLLGAVTSRDGDRVTTLELFFDLVFVFAFRQVSEIMTHDADAAGVVRGLVTLALVWWAWTSYSWLGNQARASDGVVRIGVVGATAIMFVVALAIPEAWHDLPGGLDGPLVFVVGYLLVRTLHGVVYLVAAGPDRGLRRQVLVSIGVSLTPSAALLVAGALVGGAWQLGLWVAAVVVDLLLVYVTSRAGRSWRLKSATHFAERYGLVIILALGESVIAAGALAAREPIAWPVLGVALLSVGLAVALWWSYFHHLAARAEHEVSRHDDAERAALAVDAYTYLHLLLVAGIVLVAVGIEEAMVHVPASEPLGWFAGAALGGGTALYLAGTVLFWLRVSGSWTMPRTVGAVVALGLVPALAAAPPAAAVGLTAGMLVVLLTAEQALRGRAAVQVRAAA